MSTDKITIATSFLPKWGEIEVVEVEDGDWPEDGCLTDAELAREQWDAETWNAMVTTATMAAAILQSRPVELRAASPRVRHGGTPSEIKDADERARWGWKRGVHETSKR